MERGKIGFVVGLRAEAALLRGRGFMVGVGGGTPEGARAAAAGLIDQGAAALISFGLAGGLNWALAAGHVLVPEMVVWGHSSFKCDQDLMGWLGGATSDKILAWHEIVATAEQKAALFRATGGQAVDLESGEVARLAELRGVKFAVLRAVCDTADRDLPEAALVALNARGGIGMVRVAGSVLRKPSQIPGLLGLARDAGVARRALVERVRGLR